MPYTMEGVGYRPCDTSIAAAIDLSDHSAATIKKQVLTFLRETKRKWTSDEIAENLGLDYRLVQPRTSELKNDGLILNTGETKIGKFKRPNALWIATPIHILRELQDELNKQGALL